MKFLCKRKAEEIKIKTMKRANYISAILGSAGTLFCILYMTGQMQAYVQVRTSVINYNVGLDWLTSEYFSPSIVFCLVVSLIATIEGVYKIHTNNKKEDNANEEK